MCGGGGREGQGKEMKAGRRKGRGKDGKSLLGWCWFARKVGANCIV